MSILDSLKNTATDAVHELSSAVQGAEKLVNEGIDLLLQKPAAPQAQSDVASLVQKPADAQSGNASDATATAGKTASEGFFSRVGNALLHTATAAIDVSAFLPTLAPATSLIAIGANTFKNKTSGDTVKVNENKSILSLIPGSNSIFGSSDKPALQTLAGDSKSAAASSNGSEKIFNYIPAKEWQAILSSNGSDKQAAGGGGGTASLPEAQITATGMEFSARLSQTAKQVADNVLVDGDKHIHTDADGTITTQTATTTEVDHGNGHKDVKDLSQNFAGISVGSRLAYSQNTQNGNQTWNTAQGYKVVEANGVYNVYDKDGSLVASEQANILKSAVSQEIENETLSNGQRMARHIGGRILNEVNRRLPDSGNTWDVYSDGMSRTLKDGTVIGLTADANAFVKVSDTTVLYNGKQRQFYVVNGNAAPQEIDPAKLSNVSTQEQQAIDILETLKMTGELEVGDGTFMSVKDGQVIAGQEQIVDEPVTDAAGNQTADVLPTTSEPTLATAAASADDATRQPKKKAVTLATTDADQSTAKLKGGITEKFDYHTNQSTFSDPEGQKIAAIQGPNVTTADVITTDKGTTDRVTGDFVSHNGEIKTAEGDVVSANNDIQFADGTRFNHDGTIVLANGQVLDSKGNKETADAQQATAAAAQAASIADSVVAAASSGHLSAGQIAALEASLGQIEGLINRFSGNMEVVTRLMNAEGSLEASLNNARTELGRVSSFDALRPNVAPRYNDLNMTNRFSFLKAA